jgi:hypothetical protein
LALCVTPSVVLAQTTAATISGDVHDETGAVLPGVSVTITNVDTGTTRTVVTDDEGRYRAPNLMVGSYTVAAELEGFKTTTRAGITLVIGQEAIVDFSLSLGQVSENVVVTGEAPIVDTRGAVLGGLVDQKAIVELPLNGRSFIELATLRSGAVLAQYGAQNESQGFGKKISISGSRFTSNLFLLDGTVMNDSFNSAGSAAGGVVTGVETVREFKVITNAYSAEYGQHTGGVVNAVTKSGTNALHGTVYEFLRNDNLDASNFFDVGESPEFKRNQFGGSAGGPILRDRTFFFVNYEGLRERLGLTQRWNVPSVDARNGLLRNPATGVITNVGVDPDVAPILQQIYPLPNSIDFGDGRAEFVRQVSQPTDEDFFSLRIDHTLGNNHSLFGRYTIDDAVQVAANSINVADNFVSRNQYLTLQYDRVSSTFLNSFNAGFTRTNTGKQGEMLPGFERVTFTDSEFGVGVVSVAGLGGTGSGNLDPRIFILNNFQVKNDVTYTRGAHALKFGAGVSRMQHNDTSPRQPAGQFSFQSIGDFLTNRPFDALISLAENFHRYERQTLVGAYFQDDWQLRQNLTLNLGVRWEYFGRPHETRGNNPIALEDRFFDRSVTPADVVIGDSVYQETPFINFAPRVGVAWDPFGDGRTSVRGGVGIFHEALIYWTYRLAILHTAPIFVEGRLQSAFTPVDFPDAYFTQRELFIGNPRYESIDPSPGSPYVAKASLEIQRSLTDTMAFKIGYSGSRGVNLGRSNEINGRAHQVLPDGSFFFAANEREYNPNFGRARHRTFDGRMDYHSLRLEFDKRFSGGLQFQSGYTFSKNTDDGTAITGSTDFENDNGPARHFLIKDHALSPLDVRQVFTFNFGYELPAMSGKAGAVLGGWRVNGLLRLSDGYPFSANTGFDRQRSIQGTQYPNLVPGADNDPIRPGNVDQYYDPTAFELQPVGTLGNLGRNTLTSPGIATVDASFAKTFGVSRVSDSFKVEFRAEFFNLLNRANLHLPDRSVFNSNGTYRVDAGRITRTSTAARQVQLGLKILF